jgi:transcriptional regulator with XRE-family HTH domain
MPYACGMTGRSIPTDGPAIRRARLRAGYGSVAFSTKVGITYGHLGRIETGKAKASPDLVRRIAEVLGRRVDDFITADFREVA